MAGWIHLHVELGAEKVALRATAGERANDDEPAIGGDADRRLALVPNQDLELVQERRRQDRLLQIRHGFLGVLEIRAGAGEGRTADASIVVAL